MKAGQQFDSCLPAGRNAASLAKVKKSYVKVESSQHPQKKPGRREDNVQRRGRNQAAGRKSLATRKREQKAVIQLLIYGECKKRGGPKLETRGPPARPQPLTPRNREPSPQPGSELVG